MFSDDGAGVWEIVVVVVFFVVEVMGCGFDLVFILFLFFILFYLFGFVDMDLVVVVAVEGGAIGF